MGDVLDETIASVDLIPNGDDDDNNQSVQHTHTIAVGAKQSDCATCFDSTELKTIPVATYSPSQMYKLRCASSGMVNGPTLLRSNIMVTELVLKYMDARLRVVFQHAPVWEKGIPPGQGPPQGLKLFRVMISREALRDAPPTRKGEEAMMASSSSSSSSSSTSNPPVLFYRPVPPFDWHKKWGNGTSWTWGAQIGNQGWAMPELDEETDAWHGSAPVSEWNLRLPGGVFIQSPRVITDLPVGLCRLAWLPNSDTLLRLEAGVQALQAIDDDDEMIRFAPPSLASLRCDMLQNLGDLEGEPPFSKMQLETEAAAERRVSAAATASTSSSPDTTSTELSQTPAAAATAPSKPVVKNDLEIKDPRDALRL